MFADVWTKRDTSPYEAGKHMFNLHMAKKGIKNLEQDVFVSLPKWDMPISRHMLSMAWVKYSGMNCSTLAKTK